MASYFRILSCMQAFYEHVIMFGIEDGNVIYHPIYSISEFACQYLSFRSISEYVDVAKQNLNFNSNNLQNYSTTELFDGYTQGPSDC
jgi:hypothetical protein